MRVKGRGARSWSQVGTAEPVAGDVVAHGDRDPLVVRGDGRDRNVGRWAGRHCNVHSCGREENNLSGHEKAG